MPELVPLLPGPDARIEWFYRKVCAEFNAPVSFIFINSVLPQFKSGRGSISINTQIINEHNAWAICETLKIFQKRIRHLQIFHNTREDGIRPSSSYEPSGDFEGRSSKMTRRNAC